MKEQQIQLLEIVDTLQEARRNCQSLFQTGNYDAVINLLADSQDSAVKMGEFIEQLHGTGTQTVSLLEEYCELLFRINVCIAEPQNGKPDFNAVQQLLNRIRNSIQTERIANRVEVVFFPYKASMWDSLESIWLAAEKDPQCDAIVVPIPYYDKKPNGSLGEMHYEGGDYPPYVPVVNWQEYDLAKRRPDVAFIHNPYDDKNVVTQVDSQYFTNNLKKYVGLLCYLPYFVVSTELNPHFAVLPAVLNADCVIVQSEEIRQQYLHVWADMVKEKRAKAAELKKMQKKILPLGSPKFDAVVNADGRNLNLPDDWKKFIENPDGTRKKVVYYNTSINTMLQGTLGEDNKIADRYLNKLESVLRFFKRRKDVVLLWRPHPLLEQSFASMRPQLYERYLQIVGDYRREGYGIYDNSTDLHRAIAVSDAYYGDGSSVVVLWQKTGKPLLISNMDVTDYEKRLVARNLYFDGESFWCTALEFNGLFRIEKDTLKAHYMGQFPHEKKEGHYLFSRITECEEKLYFSPLSAKNIGVYNKKTKEFSSIPLHLGDQECNLERKFSDAFTYGKYVFISGNQIPSILKIDTQTNDITVIDDWKRQLISHKNVPSSSMLAYGCRVNEKLYFPSRYANAMLVFNMSDCSSEIHPFNVKNRMYYRSVAAGDKIWVCSSADSFLGIYDIATGQTVDLDTKSHFKGFSDIQAYQGSVFCFSRSLSEILKIDAQTEQIQRFHTKENCDEDAMAGHCVYAISHLTGKMNMIDLQTMEEQEFEMPFVFAEMPDIEDKDVLLESEKYSGFACETAYLNLDMLIDIAKKSVVKKQDKENCGETIYQYIKGLVP